MKERIFGIVVGTIILFLASLLVAAAVGGTVRGVVAMLTATLASALIFLGFLFWSRALVRAGSPHGLFSGERAVALAIIVLILLVAGKLVFF